MGCSARRRGRALSRGCADTSFVELPDTTHLNYDFRALVGGELDALLESTVPEEEDEESEEEQPATSELNADVFQEFVGTNGKMLQYHYFENGDNGTLFYFDQVTRTTNFHSPLVDPGSGA